MQTAVIYCRYSSDSQTEQSIDGQLRVCTEYAKSRDILVLDTYIDRAMTGTNDNRPDFQRMIKDSAKRTFNIVLVYKFDRFSRNKYETAMHKKTLKDNGVKVVSATEFVPDTPEGIIFESMLEGYLEHISLPNGLNYCPQTDVNGRNTGKEIKNANNENVYAEYVYYRKVGDHGTNMPSSVYFGKNKNNRFAVSDNIKYKYDEMGNISEVRENGVLVVKYTYDKIGRLVREDNRKFGKSIFISYDNCGNILSKREARFTLKPADEIEVFTDEKLYAYDGDKLLSFGDEILFYTDTEGKDHENPTIYRGNNVAWNFGRQLASFGDNAFAYDGYGRRIKKNDIVFTYDANNKLVKQSDGKNTLEFIYDNSGISGVKLVKRVGDNVEAFEYIYSKDVQGNIVGILDKSGKEVVQYNYDAWGNVKTEVIDEAHALIAELNPFRYRSYYYDGETHLYYLNTRYYDPETGRFISQDDVSYLDPEHINGLNLFAYCGNNPVMMTDHSGNYAVPVQNSIWGFIKDILQTIGTALVKSSSKLFSALSNVPMYLLDDIGGAIFNPAYMQLMSKASNLQHAGKVVGAVGKGFKIVGYVLLAVECGISIYNNLTNPNLSTSRKITDSIVDVGFSVGGFLLSMGIGAAIGSAIPIPILGTVIGALVGAAIGIGIWAFQTFAFDIYNNIKVAFNTFVTETIPAAWNKFTEGWNWFWSFNWI